MNHISPKDYSTDESTHFPINQQLSATLHTTSYYFTSPRPLQALHLRVASLVGRMNELLLVLMFSPYATTLFMSCLSTEICFPPRRPFRSALYIFIEKVDSDHV